MQAVIVRMHCDFSHSFVWLRCRHSSLCELFIACGRGFPKVSTFLYGTADPEKLTAEQKDTVANIMSLAGAGVGAAVGNTSANAVSGSLNAESAVENNFSLQDVKDNWNRLTGGLLGVAASFGSAGEPILHPIDTWNGLKEFANSDDKLAVLQMGLILTVEERNQDYETFVRLNDEFGKSMVIGRSVTDITSAVTMISKTPALFKTALAQLRKTGHATINGVKVVYVSGKIARALDNYVAPVQIYKPVPAITQTAKKLPQGKGGQNTLATRERVTSNIQETRRGNQSSQFGTHAQREWENKTGLDFNHFIGGDINKKGKVTGGHSLTRGDVRVIQQTSAPDKHGVYQATVEIKKPDGSWEIKTYPGGKHKGETMTEHTMFPKDWDEARIRAEVTSAWERKEINGNKWKGESSSGVWIEGFINPNKTAYPLYNE